MQVFEFYGDNESIMVHKYDVLLLTCLLVPLFQTRNELSSSNININQSDPLDYFESIDVDVETYGLGELQGKKFMLKWTPINTYFEIGQEQFTQNNCTFTNCIVTARRDLFNDVSEYDVVFFHEPDINKIIFPEARSSDQKYVFVTEESPAYCSLYLSRFNNFFNWTWTYRMDSDINFGYILIKDEKDVTIGPKRVMHWMKLEDMDPVSDDFKTKIKSKTKAAAWFVSNCKDYSGRLSLAKNIQAQLRKYNLDVDIYGACGTMSCDRRNECDKMLSETYYFYLAFENSCYEDYVTEKLLRALKNDVVPVVYGGANYTRFMPDGIYLNAGTMSASSLAKKMYTLMRNVDQYAKFFKWKNHYSFYSRAETSDNKYCNICALINDEKKMKTETTIHNFIDWWKNSGRSCRAKKISIG